MAEGTKTYQGLAVPLLGESEVIQQTATADILTITGASGQSGDFLVLQNSAGTECFVVQTTGYIVHTVSPTGTAAKECYGMTVVDATTFSTGYGAAIYLHVTQSGAKTGSANTSQYNVIACDLTISAAAPYINHFYFYTSQSGSPDLSSALVYGGTIYVEELGATSSLILLSLEKANTTKGSNYDAFIKMSCQGSGVAKTGIYFTGTHNPDYFIQCQSVADCFDSGTGATASVNGHIKVKLGSTDGFLRVYASAS